MNEGKTHRRFPRYAVDIPVRVTRFNATGEAPISGSGTNVGRGGLQIVIGTSLRVDEAIRIEASFPYTRVPLTVSAIVRNVSGYTYGIEFMPLDHKERQAIDRACDVLELLAPVSP